MSVLSSPTSKTYRPDIDGLRAVAVIAVLIYHAFPKILPSGFIGVDVFFVISGFLITSIILKEMSIGQFSILDFYGRRIRRIFPALLIVTITVYVLGWRSLLASEYQQLGKHMAGSAGFGVNVMYWLESGYFDVASQLKPLLHLWSLGVEEQFYLFWPVFLFVLAKCGIRPLIPIVILALCSFGANILLIDKDPVQTFFLPHTRAWELALGGIVATYLDRGNSQKKLSEFDSDFSLKVNAALSLVGIALLVSAFYFVSDEKHFPGWAGLLPVFGAAILILTGKNSQLLKLILANRFMVGIGLISFPLYLWHWPLLSLLTILEVGHVSDKMKLLMLAIAVLLSILTYFLVERPIRHTGSPRLLASVLLVLMALVGYLGYNTYQREGLGFRASQFQAISKAQGEWDFPGDLKRMEIANVSLFSQAASNSAITLFVGDSNLEQYYPRINQLLHESSNTNSVIFLSEGGCLPIPHTISKENRICDGVANGVQRVIESRPQIRKVVIAAQWYGYMFHETQNAKFVLDGKFYPIALKSEGYRRALNSLSEQIRMMKQRKLEVYLILNIPVGVEFNPSYIAGRSIESLWQGFQLRTGGKRLSEFEASFTQIKKDLRVTAEMSGASVIDPTDTICRDDMCSSVDEDMAPKYKDDGHLRPAYVRKYVRFLDQTVINQ